MEACSQNTDWVSLWLCRKNMTPCFSTKFLISPLTSIADFYGEDNWEQIACWSPLQGFGWDGWMCLTACLHSTWCNRPVFGLWLEFGFEFHLLLPCCCTLGKITHPCHDVFICHLNINNNRCSLRKPPMDQTLKPIFASSNFLIMNVLFYL
jgi:hypothetical protein